jgi:hypothetical protein
MAADDAKLRGAARIIGVRNKLVTHKYHGFENMGKAFLLISGARISKL